MKSDNTYKDNGNTEWYYISNVDVVCPKCSGKANLKTRNQYQDEPELKCSNCFYSRKGFEYSTFSKNQKVVCSKCDSIFNLDTSKLITTVKKVNCKCPECNHQNQVTPEFDVYKSGGMYNIQSKDQYCGLDFWYSTRFKNDFFWAYNIEHLTEIENYVSAELRKRHEGNYQSMIEKLPNWISSSKNREAILNTIAKLKRKKS